MRHGDFPVVMGFLADGSLNVTNIGLLAPYLTDDNHRTLLVSARYKSEREVERMVAALRPLPAVPSTVRKLPAPVRPTGVEDTAERDDRASVYSSNDLEPRGDRQAAPVIAAPLPLRPPVITPLAPTRYRIQVTVSAEAHDHLRRAQDLLRHTIPSGDPALIVERALKLLVADLERSRECAQTSRPRSSRDARPRARHVPAAVKRAVWARDGGQCAFVGHDGRCRERLS